MAPIVRSTWENYIGNLYKLDDGYKFQVFVDKGKLLEHIITISCGLDDNVETLIKDGYDTMLEDYERKQPHNRKNT